MNIVRTYAIGFDGRAIYCGICGRTSFHPKDVQHLYCGHCHIFHMDTGGPPLPAKGKKRQGTEPMNLLNSAFELSAEVEAALNDVFEHYTWDEVKVRNGARVREGLKHAMREIILNVPPSADRSAAIRKIREARMDCNSAITHNGRY